MKSFVIIAAFKFMFVHVDWYCGSESKCASLLIIVYIPRVLYSFLLISIIHDSAVNSEIEEQSTE
jgi:hypothetical protein